VARIDPAVPARPQPQCLADFALIGRGDQQSLASTLKNMCFLRPSVDLLVVLFSSGHGEMRARSRAAPETFSARWYGPNLSPRVILLTEIITLFGEPGRVSAQIF